jgi:EAL and modified HD-GYP domain-containing signal transduction protein
MAVTSAPTQHQTAQGQVLVSRQPVVDGNDRVAGYRIGYALHDEHGPLTPAPGDTIELLDDLLAIIGSEEYALGNRAYLPVSREMLLHRGDVPPIDPDRVVLRIKYVDALDPAVVAVIAKAKARGYSFELDALTRTDFDPGLLRHFELIEFNLSVLGLAEAKALMPGMQLRGAVGLAAGVTTHVQRDQARALGCRWFAGPFLVTPNLIGGRPVPVGSPKTLVKISRLRGRAEDLAELIDLIERDVGLGVRLLRYINSAYFSLLGPVRSVRHAAMMLGAKGLARWALVAACVGGREQIPREHALLALTRARTCELLGEQRRTPAEPDVLFTVGLLSAVDLIFGMTREQIVQELALAGPTAAALTSYDGPAGGVLRSVIAFEQGDFQAAASATSLTGHGEAYREALIWAREAVSATG